MLVNILFHFLNIKELHLHIGENIAHHGDKHSLVSTMSIVDCTSHGREHHAAGNTSNEQRTSTLGVTTETTKTKSENGGEASRLEAKHEDQHGDRGGSGGGDGSNAEDEAEEEVHGEDKSRFEEGEHHHATGDETVECVETLADREEIRGLGF